MELDRLARTRAEPARQEVESNFQGFKQLFHKFINASGHSVDWDKIEKLQSDAVSQNLRESFESSHNLQQIFA